MNTIYIRPGKSGSFKLDRVVVNIYEGWDGKKYFETKDNVYDMPPNNKNAKALNVKLVFCNESPSENIQLRSQKPLGINKSYWKYMPNNCPVIEQTADGVEVGACTFFMPDGRTCPRHGNVYDHFKAELLGRIQNYLEIITLLKGEAINYDKVQKIIIDCREYITSTH